MKLPTIFRTILVSLVFFLTSLDVCATWSEKDFILTLRASGDAFLMQMDDSTSRVLPLEKIGQRYKMSFDSEFSFVPDALMYAVIKTFDQNEVSTDVIIETVECFSQKVVHSFKVAVNSSDVLACKERELPSGCYEIYFSTKPKMPIVVSPMAKTSSVNYLWIVLCVLLSILSVFVYLKVANKTKYTLDTGVPIGAFLFDKDAMKLTLEGVQTELSGKETDLLFLLISNLNETVDRETILNTVWGDEGNYVGRTLDVFISKLRKKLRGDENVKIVNIRGFGYKLLIEK